MGLITQGDRFFCALCPFVCFADAIGGMFSTEDGVKDFLDWLQNESGYNANEKKDILQRITEWLSDIIEAIKEIMNDGELNGAGKLFAKENCDELAKIRTMFLEALDGAGENYREGGAVEGEKSTNSTGIRFSKSIKNYPYDMQTVISDYIDSVDTRLLELINKVKNHSKEYFERYTICETSDKLIKDLEKALKIDVFGYKNAINTNAIHHIIKRHGSSGKADSSMANDNDIARMRYIIENYDSLELLTDENGNIVYSDEFRNSDNTQAPLIRLSKRINGTYYLVEAVPENKYKKIWVVSAYIKNSSAVTQAPKKSGSYLASPTSANDSISNSDKNVKQKQLEIIEKTNPAPNTYNTWIRKVEDIKTLAETLEDSDWADGDEFNPDLTRNMIEEAIESGEITVYSSYPIEQGVFVSPSYMEAASYSGDGNVHEKTVSIDDVAWIDPTQGMYAKVEENTSYSLKQSLDWVDWDDYSTERTESLVKKVTEHSPPCVRYSGNCAKTKK